MAQSISSSAVDEHRVPMPAHIAGQGKKKGATPEKQLNRFVRIVTFIERLGNALGTLAFTWATVVLLGGYPTVLCRGWFRDFWCATAIVFLEATRMFSRNNKMDYQLFFHTKGAFRRFGLHGLIVIVYLSNILNYVIILTRFEVNKVPLVLRRVIAVLLIVVPLVLGLFQTWALKLLPKPLHHAISICNPLVAILSLIPLIAVFSNETAKWTVFMIIFLPVLLLTVDRLDFPIISRFVDSALGVKKIFWRRLILNLTMLTILVMLVFIPKDPVERMIVFIYSLYALVVVSFDNLQISAAIARFVLALVRLVNNNKYYCDNTKDPIVTNPKPDDSQINLAPSLNIFYGMVLGQGALYVVACIFEIFAFIPRRSLARRSGFGGQWGMELVGLYYAYALEKSMEGDVLAPKNVNFNSFAMEYCLNSDKPNMQLHGIRIMHSLLLREETRKQLFPILINSTKTMARLIEMLDWSRPEKITIRLYAAKVTSELSTGLRVVTIPGIIQVVSALLDYGNQQQRANPLLNTDVEHEKVPDNHEERLDACEDTGNNLLLETREHSSQQVPAEQQKPSKLFRGLQCIFGTWSIPQEEPKPLTEKDLLPALGMSILDGLIGCDQDNCVEISRASGLTMKIIRFTSYGRSDTMYTDTQRKVLMASSLKLLHSLTSIDGEIGVRLRHKVSQNPFLLRNLADVLGDSMSCKELKKLVAGILRNLAIDGEARKVIGHKQVIISRLMHAFLTQDGSSSTESERLPRRVAGQALAMLAMDNANNCLAMVREPEYGFIKKLTCMIHVDRYRCVAASLLQDICRHARTELKEHDMKEISYSLREVLERIMVAEAAELEIFIGLSSQICQVIPGAFTRELEQGQIKGTFVKRLIDALNANMEPSADCPGIRRVILQQAISLMECDSRYANFFKDRGMKEALSMVEETASDVENYNLFLGDAGLIEASEPLPRLVARAKELLAVR